MYLFIRTSLLLTTSRHYVKSSSANNHDISHVIYLSTHNSCTTSMDAKKYGWTIFYLVLITNTKEITNIHSPQKNSPEFTDSNLCQAKSTLFLRNQLLTFVFKYLI